MALPKILIIEDERQIARFLELELQQEGYISVESIIREGTGIVNLLPWLVG